MSGIPLSQKHGINPAVVKCYYCGKDTGELAMCGRSYVYTCCDCKRKMVGYHTPDKCVFCDGHSFDRSAEEFDGSAGLVGVCTECAESLKHEREALDAVVRGGGVYWKCKVCGAQGAIHRNEFTEQVRRQCGVPAPKPCGVMFDHTSDPKCPMIDRDPQTPS